ncbi:unnamed protein product [Lactuca virosa]|uniref:peptidylprolyl isomerase n=1 Tax=Lactuca virosa TaxID=75947 RepID=A0AAU9M5I1_9ASTR|nr:unnamed protein product [Lactuca virosa]
MPINPYAFQHCCFFPFLVLVCCEFPRALRQNSERKGWTSHFFLFPPKNTRFKLIPKPVPHSPTQMAFWGVYLKPNEPYTLRYDDDAVPKRLRITQATLGDATRNSPARSIVRCSIGDKPAIAICSLSVKEMTCCQLDLEFEEPQTVIFSVMGPRGVYLAGYLIVPPAPTSHHHAFCHEEKKKAPASMENAGCSDAHELDSNKTDPIKDSTTAQITDINHCDKIMNGGKRSLKCYSGNEIGKDDNQDPRFGSHKKYINRQQPPGSSNEDGEKSSALKLFSVFGRFLEEKRDAIEKKKKKRRNMKWKLRTPNKTKEKEKKHKRSKFSVEDNSFGKMK